MPYNSIIDRTEGAALIREDASREIIKGVVEKSAALKLFRHMDMGTAQTRIPVLAALPTAYWVNGDTGFKDTTEMSWSNVFLNAEEVAAIVPIPEKLLDDTSYDLWGQVKPSLEEAIAIALDDAVFFGTNKPASWPTAIVPAAVAAGNVVIAGTGVDYADDVNNAVAAVEADGFFPDGFFGRMQVRAKLRGLRDAQRGLIFQPEAQANVAHNPLNIGTLFNEPIMFSRGGFAGFATGATNYSLITGDFEQAILGMRQDITYKILDQAVITTNAVPPVIQYNLAQQDMVAMRVVARYGFAVPNPMSRLAPTVGTRYPFAVIQQKASTGGE